VTDFPARGQQAPDFWDTQLKGYIDERIAAAQSTGDAAVAAAAAAQGVADGAVTDITAEEAARIAADVALEAEIASLTAGSTRGFFYPENYVGSPSDIAYPNNAITAWNAAMADAAAVGGTVIGSQLYGGGDGDITQLNGVTVLMVGGTNGPSPGLTGFKATHANFRYRYGNHTGNPYPGPLHGLMIDGDNIANECFRAEAVENSVYDLHVMNAVVKCVDLGSSQNLNFYNANIGSCTEGTALLIKAKQAGAQPPGHCVFFGGHLGDSKKTIHVTSFDASFFTGPHDNYFIGTIIETGRAAYDIDNAIQLDDGDTHFIGCNETIGAQVTAINNDCAVLIQNAIRTTASTTMEWHSGSFGGGAGAVKASHGVKVKSVDAIYANTVYYSGRISLANFSTNFHTHDTFDGSIQAHAMFIDITAIPNRFGAINGGGIAGILNKSQVPVRYETQSTQANPLQFRRLGDAANRGQITRDFTLQWLDGSSGAVQANIIRSGAGLAINGANLVQEYATTTALRPAASTVQYRTIHDITLGRPIWSDGTNWKDYAGATV
jgi:hypothetical protein